MLTSRRKRAFIAVLRMEVIVYVPGKVLRAMEPRPHADKQAIRKPFWPVVTVGSAIVGGHIIVTIGAHRGRSNFDSDTDLSICFWGRSCYTDGKSRRQR